LFLNVGCAGLETFPTAAKAGDTISLAAGWKQTFSPDELTVTFSPSVGDPVTYLPGDPAVRASINWYPDPVSNLTVGHALNVSGYSGGDSYGDVITAITDGDRDWWQTIVMLDLPPTLPVGTTQITIDSVGGESYGPIPVEIIDGSGSANAFNAEGLGPVNEMQLTSLGRARHYVVSFSGTTIPYAMEVSLSHIGSEIHVVNPRGDIKSLQWKDDGTMLKVILAPSGSSILRDLKDFKFYVAGDSVSDLIVTDIQAFDRDGYSVTGVVPTVSAASTF